MNAHDLYCTLPVHQDEIVSFIFKKKDNKYPSNFYPAVNNVIQKKHQIIKTIQKGLRELCR